ncbi:MAG: flavodoxin family protein [Deferrisomatales bacterium]
MKILGISGSPRRGSTTDRLVQAVLDGAGGNTEFVPLAGRRIGPCMACLGCVEDNVCKVRDDMAELREQVVAADALVIGAPNYFGLLNGLTHCFLERFYQFRHRDGKALAGKLGAVASVGGRVPDLPVENLRTFFAVNQIECVGAVSAQGPASCFSCGYGEACHAGAVRKLFGSDARITPENTPALAKQPDKIEAARALGAELARRFLERAAAT